MLKHAIPPARFFSQTPNEIIRHPRLNGTAVRLLQWALSLPEGSRDTVQSIGEKMPEGRLAVRKARRQLEEEGYLHTRRTQNPQTGRWSTQVLVSNVALTTDADIAAAFGTAPPPTDQHPPVGEVTDQAVGTSTFGENTEENTSNPAADFLARLGDHTPSLRLGAGEVERLTPLAARWLATGATEAELRQAVTADLPVPVKSAAALISYRLKARTPTTPAPHKRVAPLGECTECRDPLPRGTGKGICRNCAALPPTGPSPSRSFLSNFALVRAALTGVS
ncbi:hypothetical protein [Streptomyces sp. WM6386]|uniref:hypothetical protein n=1 Tax=Streptomyces sp. WM6386 TaxID=1415558 RepID=UPI0007C7BA25|nr:hypothetical protein [Streptomyces sp. WM6386]